MGAGRPHTPALLSPFDEEERSYLSRLTSLRSLVSLTRSLLSSSSHSYLIEYNMCMHVRVRIAVINAAVSPPEMRCNARLANDSCCLCCPPLVRENAVGAAGTVEE